MGRRDERSGHEPGVAAVNRLRRAVGYGFVAALALLALSWLMAGRLPGPDAIDPALTPPPRQEATDRRPFTFPYKGRSCRVRPVATYELTGVVVSHNDISSVADIYHDRTSVDTKDLCVVWGPNLATGQYLQSRYKSGPFTCYVHFREGVPFDLAGLGNNHLITDSPAIRRQIAGVQIGDQVRLRGLLVDYQMEDWEGFWRRTSTRRDDFDCEVLFVERIDVLHRATPGWYAAGRLARLLLVALPLLWILLYWLQIRSGDSVSVGQI